MQAVNREMEVRFLREAVTVRRGVCPRSQVSCPCGVNFGHAGRMKCRGLPDEMQDDAEKGLSVSVSLFFFMRYPQKKKGDFFMSKQKKILAAAGLLVLVAALLTAYFCLRPEAQVGSKTVELTVTHGDGSAAVYTMHTDAETLRAALDELDLLVGEDGPYGIFVTAVDGESVDSANEEWWCFTKDGEMLMTGLDDTMIADGERYEAVFTVGYDLF